MDPSDCSGPHPTDGFMVPCSGPHPSEGRPLCAALERFLRDSFKQCLCDPVYSILSRAGATDDGLIMGCAAESADAFLSELKLFATSAHLMKQLDLLEDPLRIVWAYARATAALCVGGGQYCC